MLHEFLSSNRAELIRRCLVKERHRSQPRANSRTLEHGVPVFLEQLVQVLRRDETDPAPHSGGIPGPSSKARASMESRAGMHGKELFEEGYTVDQVVHDYGDICQAITELAQERNAPITVDEFHTFNGLLDNAMADAVCSFGHHREQSVSALGAHDLHQRLGTLADEQRKLLDTALKALAALQRADPGLTGKGSLLENTLLQLRAFIDKSLPEIRLSSGMTTAPNPERG